MCAHIRTIEMETLADLQVAQDIIPKSADISLEEDQPTVRLRPLLLTRNVSEAHQPSLPEDFTRGNAGAPHQQPQATELQLPAAQKKMGTLFIATYLSRQRLAENNEIPTSWKTQLYVTPLVGYKKYTDDTPTTLSDFVSFGIYNSDDETQIGNGQIAPQFLFQIPRSEFDAFYNNQDLAKKPFEEESLFDIPSDVAQSSVEAPVVPQQQPLQAQQQDQVVQAQPLILLNDEQLARVVQVTISARTQASSLDSYIDTTVKTLDKALSAAAIKIVLAKIKKLLQDHLVSVEQNQEITSSKKAIKDSIEILIACIDNYSTGEDPSSLTTFNEAVADEVAKIQNKHTADSGFFSNLFGQHSQGLLALANFKQLLAEQCCPDTLETALLNTRNSAGKADITTYPALNDAFIQLSQAKNFQNLYSSLKNKIASLALKIAHYYKKARKNSEQNDAATAQQLHQKIAATITEIDTQLYNIATNFTQDTRVTPNKFHQKLLALQSQFSSLKNLFLGSTAKASRNALPPQQLEAQSFAPSWNANMAKMIENAKKRSWNWFGITDGDAKKIRIEKQQKLKDIADVVCAKEYHNIPSTMFLEKFIDYVVAINKPYWRGLTITSTTRYKQVERINTALSDLFAGRMTNFEFLQILFTIRDEIEKEKNLFGSELQKKIVMPEIERITDSFLLAIKYYLAPSLIVEANEPVSATTFAANLQSLLNLFQKNKKMTLVDLKKFFSPRQIQQIYSYLGTYMQQNFLGVGSANIAPKCALLAQHLIDIYYRTNEKDIPPEINEADINKARTALATIEISAALRNFAKILDREPLDASDEAQMTTLAAEKEKAKKAIEHLVQNIATPWNEEAYKHVKSIAEASDFTFIKQTEHFWGAYTLSIPDSQETKAKELAEILAQKANNYALKQMAQALASHDIDTFLAVFTRAEPYNFSLFGEKYPKSYTAENGIAIIPDAGKCINTILATNDHAKIKTLFDSAKNNPQLWSSILSLRPGKSEFEERTIENEDDEEISVSDENGQTILDPTDEHFRLASLHGLSEKEEVELADLIENKDTLAIRRGNEYVDELVEMWRTKKLTNPRTEPERYRYINAEYARAKYDIEEEIAELQRRKNKATMPKLIAKAVAALIATGKPDELIGYLNTQSMLTLHVKRQTKTIRQITLTKGNRENFDQISYIDADYQFGTPAQITNAVVTYFTAAKAKNSNSWSLVFTGEIDQASGCHKKSFTDLVKWAMNNKSNTIAAISQAAQQIIAFATKVVLEHIDDLCKKSKGERLRALLSDLMQQKAVKSLLIDEDIRAQIAQRIDTHTVALLPHSDEQDYDAKMFKILTGESPVASLPWPISNALENAAKQFPQALDSIADVHNTDSPHINALRTSLTTYLTQRAMAIFPSSLLTTETTVDATARKQTTAIAALEAEIAEWHKIPSAKPTGTSTADQLKLAQWIRFQYMLVTLQATHYLDNLATRYVELLFAQQDYTKIITVLTQGYVIRVYNSNILNPTAIVSLNPAAMINLLIAQYNKLYESTATNPNDRTWTTLFTNNTYSAFLTNLINWAQETNNINTAPAQTFLAFVDNVILAELNLLIKRQLTDLRDNNSSLAEFDAVITAFKTLPTVAARIKVDTSSSQDKYSNKALRDNIDKAVKLARAEKQAQLIEDNCLKNSLPVDNACTQLGITSTDKSVKFAALVETVKSIKTTFTNESNQTVVTNLTAAATRRLEKELTENPQSCISVLLDYDKTYGSNDTRRKDTTPWQDSKMNLEVLRFIREIATTFAAQGGTLVKTVNDLIAPKLTQATQIINNLLLSKTSTYLNPQITGLLHEQTNALVTSIHLLNIFGNVEQRQLADNALAAINALLLPYLNSIAFPNNAISTDWQSRIKALLLAYADSTIQSIITNIPDDTQNNAQIYCLKQLAKLEDAKAVSDWVTSSSFQVTIGSGLSAPTRAPVLTNPREFLAAKSAWLEAQAQQIDSLEKLRIHTIKTASVAIAICELPSDTSSSAVVVSPPQPFSTATTSNAVLTTLKTFQQNLTLCQTLHDELKKNATLTKAPSLLGDAQTGGPKQFTVPSAEFANLQHILPQATRSSTQVQTITTESSSTTASSSRPSGISLGLQTKHQQQQSQFTTALRLATWEDAPPKLQVALARINSSIATTISPDDITALNSAYADMYCQQLTAYLRLTIATDKNQVINAANDIFSQNGKFAPFYAMIIAPENKADPQLKARLAEQISKVFREILNESTRAAYTSSLKDGVLDNLSRSQATLAPEETLPTQDKALVSALKNIPTLLEELRVKYAELADAQKMIRVFKPSATLRTTGGMQQRTNKTAEEIAIIQNKIEQTKSALEQAINLIKAQGHAYHKLSLYSNLLGYLTSYANDESMITILNKLITNNFNSREDLLDKLFGAIQLSRTLSRTLYFALRIDLADESSSLKTKYDAFCAQENSPSDKREKYTKIQELIGIAYPNLMQHISDAIAKRIVVSEPRTESVGLTVSSELRQQLWTTNMCALMDAAQQNTLLITQPNSTTWLWTRRTEGNTQIWETHPDPQHPTSKFIYNLAIPNQLKYFEETVSREALNPQATYTSKEITYTNLDDTPRLFHASTAAANSSTTIAVYNLDEHYKCSKEISTALRTQEAAISDYGSTMGAMVGTALTAIVDKIPKIVIQEKKALDTERLVEQKRATESPTTDELAAFQSLPVMIGEKLPSEENQLNLARSYQPDPTILTHSKTQHIQRKLQPSTAQKKRDSHAMEQFQQQRRALTRSGWSCAMEANRDLHQDNSSSRPAITSSGDINNTAE